MIYFFLSNLISLAAISFVVYIHWRHVRELEILMKARSLPEARSYSSKPNPVQVEDIPPISEVIENMEPNQIRSIFTRESAG